MLDQQVRLPDHAAAVVLGDVEVEVRDPGTGVVERYSLADVPTLAVEEHLPIRQPASYHGQWSKPGWFYFSSLDRLIGYESLFEAWVLLDLDFTGTCVEVLPQPCRIHFGRLEAPYRHVPDYLIRHYRGDRQLIDVKGALQAGKPRNRLVFDLTRQVCDEVGWRFTVASEPRPAYFRNVRLIAGVRHPRWSAVLDAPVDALVEEAVRRGGLTWGEAERWLAVEVDPWLASRVVARAVWLHLLHADLGTPLHAGTRLTTPDDAVVAVAGTGGGYA